MKPVNKDKPTPDIQTRPSPDDGVSKTKDGVPLKVKLLLAASLLDIATGVGFLMAGGMARSACQDNGECEFAGQNRSLEFLGYWMGGSTLSVIAGVMCGIGAGILARFSQQTSSSISEKDPLV